MYGFDIYPRRASHLRIRRQRWMVAAVFVRRGISENKLQRKLSLASSTAADLGSILAGDGLANSSEIAIGIANWQRLCRWIGCRDRRADASVRIGEIRVVENIENVRSELHSESLANQEVLHPGKVELEVGGGAH